MDKNKYDTPAQSMHVRMHQQLGDSALCKAWLHKGTFLDLLCVKKLRNGSLTTNKQAMK